MKIIYNNKVFNTRKDIKIFCFPLIPQIFADQFILVYHPSNPPEGGLKLNQEYEPPFRGAGG